MEVKVCQHCGKEILEFIQGCCPLCGVYRVILPEGDAPKKGAK